MMQSLGALPCRWLTRMHRNLSNGRPEEEESDENIVDLMSQLNALSTK